MVRTVAIDMESPGVDLDLLSREFASVVERIQGLLASERIRDLDSIVSEDVEVAERAVDARARDLRAGLGDRNDWDAALDAYEQAWMRAIGNSESVSSIAA